MEEYITHSRDETVALGRRLAAELAPGSLIAFTGGLGAGKTAFCQGIAEGLGCTDPVSSPTFAIVNYYRGPRPFAHFDLYRIHTEVDLSAAGFYDYLDMGAVVAAEWSENCGKAAGTVGHGVQIQLGRGQSAGFQGGIHHGQQGLAVGQPGVGSYLI